MAAPEICGQRPVGGLLRTGGESPMRRLVLNTGAALGLGCLALAGTAPVPAAAQSTSTQQCGIQQAADLAVQRQLTLIDAAKTNTSEFFSGANSCIANELLSSIDLSTLIPDLSGFLTSAAATTTITKLIDAAKKKGCDIVNPQINNVISQINNKLYQFQSTMTGDLSCLIHGAFSPIRTPNISSFGTETLAQPNAGCGAVFTPGNLPQPAATAATSAGTTDGTAAFQTAPTTGDTMSTGSDW